MKTSLTKAALLGTLTLAAMSAGCGGNPIIGRWLSRMTVSGVQTETTFNFRSDNFVDVTITRSFNTDAAMRAACTETVTVQNRAYETMGAGAARTVAIGVTGTCRIARTGCSMPMDNLAEMNCPVSELDPVAMVNGTYSVENDRLSITLNSSMGMTSTMYTCTRQ